MSIAAGGKFSLHGPRQPAIATPAANIDKTKDLMMSPLNKAANLIHAWRRK